jgi:hypothetical protein
MIMILPSALRDNSAGNLQFSFLLKIEPHYQGLLFEEAYK